MINRSIPHITEATIPRPQCDNTAITFQIPTDDLGFNKIRDKIKNFKCPVCDADYSESIVNTLGVIYSYNNAATALTTTCEFTKTSVVQE